VVVAALAVTAILALTCGGTTQQASADGVAPTIQVTPASGLADGQAFTVRVDAVPGTTVINSGFCDPDMPAPTDQDDLTEWCTSTVGNGQPGGLAPADPSGVVELTVQAGVGSATKTSPARGTTHTWQCDVASPCRLSLVISEPGQPAIFDVSTLLTYRSDDPTAGCGGPAPDRFASVAPDRLTEQWIAWSVGDCGSRGLATTAAFENDGASLAQFDAGSVDLAYGATAPGTPGFDSDPRPSVATPVALNAVVLAVAGYYPSDSSVPSTRLWRHIDQVKMTTTEVASLLSGRLGLDEDLQASLIARNPQLATQGGAIGFTNAGTLAGPQATTYFMSRALAKEQPEQWAYPDSTSKFGDDAGKPLGTFSDYNLLTNSVAMVNLSSGKPQLVGDIYRKLAERPDTFSLVSFFLTDLATARQLGMSPVAIGDGTTFVSPTPASVAAAVPALTKGAAGTLQPGASVPDGAYPLTYVEYAVSPKEKVLDDSCKANPTELAALKRWLGFLTGAGQDPSMFTTSGLVPLTADLQTEAQATIAQVGTAKTTFGPCAPKAPSDPPTTPTSPNVPSGPGGGASGDLPIGGAPGGSVPGLGGPTGELPTGSSPGSGARTPTGGSHHAAQLAADVAVPALGRAIGSPILLGALGLPLLILALSWTSWFSTGRRLRLRTILRGKAVTS